eukprot:CAMPEP_0183309280 /NCGR_PEP_ID=MMETSP0160_2-20130417/24801_1 /TAXON_ID=2839 ORGANISM="Odontella Sinensis, Strain Grunow 1884" /NCGR_SAMPLE_ID=MMETSP0160_2 /ASSEMBLY_ACC=CAM_ASM_000250 /LENGTH=211 /DNA_ID=CAMNT_0025473283 /DNA_START=117 /DNA_END=753 /DNA_ORIENTATION=+
MTEIITHPQENDVLCGRGGATNNHEGNKRYRAIVADHQTEYLHAKKREKAGIARVIVGIVHSRGGRFLKKLSDGTDGWTDVGDKKATEKTSQALREGLDVEELRKPKAATLWGSVQGSQSRQERRHCPQRGSGGERRAMPTPARTTHRQHISLRPSCPNLAGPSLCLLSTRSMRTLAKKTMQEPGLSLNHPLQAQMTQLTLQLCDLWEFHS